MTKEKEITLVEIEPGIACVLGNQVPEKLDLVAPTFMPHKATSDLTKYLSKIVAGSNIAAQAMNLASLQGLVRLTPETVKKIEMGYRLISAQDGSGFIGVLAQPGSSKFAASVGFTPLTSLDKLALGGPGIAMAVALATVQMQLNQIQSSIEECKDISLSILEEIRIENWAEIQALQEILLKAIEESSHAGAVIDDIWDNVSGKGYEANKLKKLFSAKVEKHLRLLEQLKSTEKQYNYLEENSQAILQDTQGLIQAQNACFSYEALRVGHLYSSDKNPEETSRLIEKIIKDAKQTYENDMACSARLINQLNLCFSLLAELDSGWNIPFLSNNKELQIREASKWLLGQIRLLSNHINFKEPVIPTPKYMFREDKLNKSLRIFKWLLENNEELVAIAPCYYQGQILPGLNFLAITNQRVIIADLSDFESEAKITDSIGINNIRYVRSNKTETVCQKEIKLDIITKNDDYNLVFDNLCEDDQEDVTKIIDILQSFMNIPESEIPHSAIENVTYRNLLD